MEMMLTNAKLADWMRSFSELEPPKLKSRTTFQWMENDIIPFWLFPNDTDRILDIEDDQYFDEYIDYQTRLKSHQRFDKIMFCIFLFLNLCQLLVLHFLSYLEDFSRLHGILARYPSLLCALYAAFWVSTLRFWTL